MAQWAIRWPCGVRHRISARGQQRDGAVSAEGQAELASRTSSGGRGRAADGLQNGSMARLHSHPGTLAVVSPSRPCRTHRCRRRDSVVSRSPGYRSGRAAGRRLREIGGLGQSGLRASGLRYRRHLRRRLARPASVHPVARQSRRLSRRVSWRAFLWAFHRWPTGSVHP